MRYFISCALFIFLNFFPSLSLANQIQVERFNDVPVTINPNYTGWFYKSVDMILCAGQNNSAADIDIYYHNKFIGVCGDNGIAAMDGVFLNGKDKSEKVTSGPIHIILRSHLEYDMPVTISVYDYVYASNSQDLGDVNTTARGMSLVKANVVNSIVFNKLTFDKTESKTLLSPSPEEPGKVIIKPSLSESSNRGLIQSDNHHFSIPYTIEGASWSAKDGGWVIESTQQNVSHNLIINPDRIKLQPGSYNGFVTVTIVPL